MAAEAENRLSKEKSPYLKSASHQPVQWYPWSEEAFKKAQELDRPILLDIGAVWCHWCHVIDRESYENLEIAKIINDLFIPIKVDRDERPDIDTRYQLAVNAISGQGGWPLTVLLTPDGNAFYGGTYFPPEDSHGRPGFKTLLKRIADIYKEKREALHQDSARLHEALKENLEKQVQAESIPPDLVEHVLQTMLSTFDKENGGFGDQPKFPHANAIELAISRTFFKPHSGLLEMIEKTLTSMAKGGVYDQIGGGFHRYSTDEQWKVPHFEKMSYDNSELLKNYVHAYQLTRNPFFKETALGILNFVNQVLSNQEQGGFYASQDADINLEDDGDYFTWTREEARALLGSEEAKIAFAYYDIGEQGEMHHHPEKNVLFIAQDLAAIAKENHLSEEEVTKKLTVIKSKLAKARENRPTPYIDRTLYAHWNGMMIQAYFEFFKAFGETQARDFALRTLDLLLKKSFHEKAGFYHAYAEGEARIPGFLDDQIQMALALLSAYEITSDIKYLEYAKKVTDLSLEKFWDSSGGGFFDAEEPKQAIGKLSIRHKSIQDSPTPSGNGVAVLVLDKLYFLTGESTYREKAEATLKAFASQISHLSFFAATYAVALDFHLQGPLKILIVGEPSESLEKLKRTAWQTFHPYKLIQVIQPQNLAHGYLDPAIRAIVESTKDFQQPKAYVCQGQTCQKPTSDAQTLAQLIAKPFSS